MPYATQQDLIGRIGEDALIDLTDRADPPTGAIDATVVDEALGDADAIIDGHIRVRYALPLAETPPLLKRLAVDIAIYALHRFDVPELVAGRHSAAIDTLKGLAAGRVELPVADGSEAPAAPTEAVVQAPPRRLDRGSLEGY